MTGDTAAEVSRLYQEFPYPAHGVVSQVVATMLHDTVRRRRAARPGRPLRLLDAGCGTGEQTLGVARAFPDVEVVGVDLNRASLELARDLAAHSGLRASFQRHDLMQPLDHLGRFDVVVSVGVLHTLADSATGFRNLRRVVEPDGAFLGMVYGAYGKWRTFRIRDALGELCGALSRRERVDVLAEAGLATNTGPLHYVETFLTRRRFGPSIPLLEAARRVLAGRSKTYQADAFTHVKETAYTWRELATLLEDTGWSLQGWPTRSGMPDRPEQVLRGRALELIRGRSLLDQASIYERLVCPELLYFLAAPG